MICPEFDWKAYVLGETSGPERLRMEQHLRECDACREEADLLAGTIVALKRAPAREVPRRIAFVSDPVFEQSWWQKIWSSTPQLAFGSAAMLSLAIMAHALIVRTAPVAPVTISEKQMEQRIQAEVSRRLPEAVRETVRAELRPALQEFGAKIEQVDKVRVAGVERKVEQQRMTDLRNLESAFSLIERRLNTMLASNARYGGD